MKFSTYEKVNILLQNFLEEKDKLQKQIDENNLRISEVLCFSQELLGKGEEDFKIFSPRRPEDLYKTELQESDARKAGYERQNIQLVEERDKLESVIDVLQNVLEESGNFEKSLIDPDEEQDNESDIDLDMDSDKSEDENSEQFILFQIQEMEGQKIARDLYGSVLEDLLRLSHRAELCNKFIRQDPVRAGMELKAVVERLSSISDIVSETISELQPVSFDGLNLREFFEKIISSVSDEKLYELDVELDEELESVSCEKKYVLGILYQIVSECLDNICCHAYASKIIFHSRLDDGKCVVRIEDDGIGFIREEVCGEYDDNQKKKQYGLEIVEKCVKFLDGKFEVDSKPDEGTRITLEIPVWMLH